MYAKRLPRKYNRPTSKYTREYLQRKRALARSYALLPWKRAWRRSVKIWQNVQSFSARWLLVGTGIVAAIVFAVLIFSPIVSVRSIQLKNTSHRVDTEEVQTLLRPLFGRHLFFVGAHDVLSILQEKQSDIAGVKVEKAYPDRLIVELELTPLVAKITPLQSEAAESNSGSTAQYFVTSKGILVQAHFPSEEDLLLPEIIITDYTNVLTDHAVLIEPTMLQNMQTAEQLLEQNFGLDIKKRLVHVYAQEYHLYIDDRALWFDDKSTVDQQLARYKKFLETKISFPVTQYIDLRLQDRVIWK